MLNPRMQLPRTIDQTEMRVINRSAILEYLRLVKFASRTEIAHELKISMPTAMRIIDQLVEDRLVRFTGEKEFGKGRSRNLLELSVKENLVVGVDMGGSHISGALINIGGEIIHGFRNSIGWKSGEENYNELVDFIKMILDQTKDLKTKTLGIAIGVPGIIESHSGIIKLAPSLGWKDYQLLQELEKVFDLPIIIENDVNLAALGEHWFGAGVGSNDLVMMALGTGIGAGIILNGKLYRGHADASGEIGYIVPGVKFLDNQYPGFGALESIASGKGIAERATEKLAELFKGQTFPEIDTAYVFQAAKDGKEWAIGIVDATIDYLSLAIANITACLDPELIILGGGISDSAEMLIEPIKKRITGVIPRVPIIKESLLKDNAAILGAVVRVFQRFIDYSVVLSD
jgi:glucokinase